MKKRFLAKLRARAGESIAETLVGLLIAALALTMLAGALGSASNIVNKSRTAMNEYYKADSAKAQAGLTTSGQKLIDALAESIAPVTSSTDELGT